MRALDPHTTGYAVNPHDGVRSYFEIYGPDDTDLTLALLPTWSLVHSRIWKMQIPYFARHGYRVITWDGRGNGRSGRPEEGYSTHDFVEDALAVLDEAGIDRVVVAGFSAGGRWAIQLTAQHPEHTDALILIAPSVNLQQPDGRAKRARLETFLDEPPDREGWNKYNAVHWREDYSDFARWFAGEIFSEPHSTKGIDDIVDWSRGGDGEMLVQTMLDSSTPRLAEFCEAVCCPVLMIHGDDDRIIPLETSQRLQVAMPQTELVVIEGAGHAPQVRDPIKANLIIHDFLRRHRASVGERGVPHACARPM